MTLTREGEKKEVQRRISFREMDREKRGPEMIGKKEPKETKDERRIWREKR